MSEEEGSAEEESKMGLSGQFNRLSESIVEGDASGSGLPLQDGDQSELAALSGENALIAHPEAEYGEIDGA